MEGTDLDARLTKISNIAFLELTTADLVIQEVYADTAFRGLLQVMLKAYAEGVMAHDEELDEHVVFGGIDAGEEALEGGFSIDQQLGAVVMLAIGAGSYLLGGLLLLGRLLRDPAGRVA